MSHLRVPIPRATKGQARRVAEGPELLIAQLQDMEDFPTAQKKMTFLEKKQYRPIPANQKAYDQLYKMFGLTRQEQAYIASKIKELR